jgi:hypothetical protein
MESRKLRSSMRPDPINTDYSHIKSDLRRIALIAICFIVAMVALSFVIK